MFQSARAWREKGRLLQGVNVPAIDVRARAFESAKGS
jgi:hypothetical protein